KTMIVLLDIDQAIPTHEIKLLAVVDPDLPMTSHFVDLLWLETSLGSQSGHNRFHACGGECRSATSTAHFLQTFLELRCTGNQHRHGRPSSTGAAMRAMLGMTPLGAQTLEHRFGAAHPILPWRLHGEIDHFPIRNEHRIALGTEAKTATAQILLQP